MGRTRKKPNPDEVEEVLREYDAVRENYDAPCKDNHVFADYESRHDSIIPIAQSLCVFTCKIAKTCGKYAMVVKPDTGIWDGNVWENGKIKIRANLDKLGGQ